MVHTLMYFTKVKINENNNLYEPMHKLYKNMLILIGWAAHFTWLNNAGK